MKKRIKSNPISDTFYFLGIIWKINPLRVILTFVQQLCGFGEWVFFTVIFMRCLFGAAELTRSFEETVLFVIISLIVLAATAGFEIWMSRRYVPMTDPELYRRLNELLFNKATNVDISCYEDAEFYDSYTRASSEAYARAVSVLNNTAAVFGAAFASIYVIITIFTINWIAGLFSFLPVIGSFLFGSFINRIEYNRRMEHIPEERRLNHVNRVICLQKYAKELRMTKIFSVLDRTYDRAYHKLMQIYDKYWKSFSSSALSRGFSALRWFSRGCGSLRRIAPWSRKRYRSVISLFSQMPSSARHGCCSASPTA